MKLNFVLLVALFLYTNACFAYNIKTDNFNIKTNEFSTIQKEIQSASNDTLIVFDIDGVLLNANDQILKLSNRSAYEEILGHYTYIILNTKNQLSDKQLKNEIKKAIERGVLTRNSCLYQYNIDTNVLRCLYIRETGRLGEDVVVIAANKGENLKKIISKLDLSATNKNEFRRLALNKIKIIDSKTSAQRFEKLNEKEIAELEPKDEEKKRLEAKNTESMLISQAKEVPVDNRMVGLIKHLQMNGTKVLALTSVDTGSYGQITSMETLRINRLKQSGYYFDRSWIGVKDRLLDQFLQNTTDRSSSAQKLEKKGIVFSKGVVLTNSSPKGGALMAFLHYTNAKPKKIIFIDDLKENLKTVEMEARKNNIQFFGIEYTAAIDARIEPLNIKRARIQLDIFKKNHKWLSDKEADEYVLEHQQNKQ